MLRRGPNLIFKYFFEFGMTFGKQFNKRCRACSCIWPQPYDPDFDLSMSNMLGMLHEAGWLYQTGLTWKDQIWVTRLRSNTWMSLAMHKHSTVVMSVLMFYAEGFHSGHHRHHMGIHCDVACASVEIQIIGNLFWTLEVNCHCILAAAQYCFQIKKNLAIL